MNSTHRYEIIDKCDIIVAVADTKEDAREAAQIHKGYIFDTLTRKVVK